MKLALLQSLFARQYPDGYVRHSASVERGAFTVRYRRGGKSYHYSEPTVSGLARVLGLVDEESIEEFGRRVMVGVGNGVFEFIGPHGAGDTIRWHLPQYQVACSVVGRDQYDTTLAAYTLSDRDPDDPWRCG